MTYIDTYPDREPIYEVYDRQELIDWLGDNGGEFFDRLWSSTEPETVETDDGGIRFWVAGALSPRMPRDIIVRPSSIPATDVRRVLDFVAGREPPVAIALGDAATQIVKAVRALGLPAANDVVTLTETQVSLIRLLDDVGGGSEGATVDITDPLHLRALRHTVACTSCKVSLMGRRAFWYALSPRCAACFYLKELEDLLRDHDSQLRDHDFRARMTAQTAASDARIAAATQGSGTVPFGLGFLIGRHTGGR